MKKKIIIALVILIVAGGFYFGFRKLSSQRDNISQEEPQKEERSENEVKESSSDEESDTLVVDSEEIVEFQELTKDEELDLIKKCEDGQWVDLAESNAAGKLFAGKLLMEVPFEEEEGEQEVFTDISFSLDGRSQVLTPKQTILDFFADREVQIEGVEEPGSIRAAKIRCAGKEINKEIGAFRQEVMNYVRDNLSTLAPKKDNWEVDGFSWPGDNYVYVEYEVVIDDEAEEEEVDDNIYRILYEVSKKTSAVSVKQIAYMKMGEEDWEVMEGQDRYKDAQELDFYEYESDLKKWVRSE